MDEKIIKLATDLHGHLAPGIALGLRMSELALSNLGMNRGNKHLIAISETARCLADAMQAATGCTPGHGNAFVEDYGKLSITVGDAWTNKGVRVALREYAKNHSPLMNKWMMRLGRLTRGEEDELGIHLLEMDEIYFLIQDVRINRPQNFHSSDMVRCMGCSEPVPRGMAIIRENTVYCKACTGEAYYTLLEGEKNRRIKL